METTAPVVTTDVSTGPVDAAPVETSSGGEDSGYSEWLAKLNGPKAEEPKSEEPKAEEAKEEESVEETKTEEPASPQSLKVGDKEYKAEDIQGLEKSVEDIKDQVGQLIELLRTSPGEIFDRLEIPKEAIEDYYYSKYVEPETLTAEQKLERYEKRDRETREQAQKEESDRAASQSKEAAKQKWVTDINSALSEAKLPQTDFNIARVAALAKEALSSGKQPDLKQLAAQVKQELLSSQTSLLSSMSPEELTAALGKETVAKLRQAELAKVKESKFQNTNPGKGEVKTKSSEVKRKISSVYDMLD